MRWPWDNEWEGIVNQVCIQGDPGLIRAASGQWGVIFSNAASVAAEIRTTIKQIEPIFGGAAGKAYRDRLEAYAKNLEDIREKNESVIQLLDSAAGSLETAQATMPIPDTMLDEVRGRSEQLAQANRAGTVAMGVVNFANPLTYVGAGAYFLGGDSFRSSIESTIGNVGREVFGEIVSWIDDGTEDAKRIRSTANNQYGTHDSRADPGQVAPPVGHNYGDYGNKGGGGGGGGGGIPDLGTGSGPDPNAFNADTSGFTPPETPGLGTDGPGVDTPGIGGGGGGFDPDLPGSGLAGAGGGLGSGPGLGAGGLGAGAGLGGGGGGLGAGGLGPGGLGAGGAGTLGGKGLGAGGLGAMGGVGAGARPNKPVGKGVSPGGLLGGAGAGRGGAGAGRGNAAGARGAGARGAVAGGIPGRGGAGADGEAEHDSWLVEDEDVWGSNDAPPSLLG